MTATRHSHDRQAATRESPDVRATARHYGALNLLAGLLGLVGPLVWENDDEGPVNVESGLFLGLIAVNGPHAALHALHGLHGLSASRDAESARRYMGLSAVFFAVFAAVGIRQFGFERGVHSIAGLAVDGWGNLGHLVLSAFGLWTLLGADEESG